MRWTAVSVHQVAKVCTRPTRFDCFHSSSASTRSRTRSSPRMCRRCASSGAENGQMRWWQPWPRAGISTGQPCPIPSYTELSSFLTRPANRAAYYKAVVPSLVLNCPRLKNQRALFLSRPTPSYAELSCVFRFDGLYSACPDCAWVVSAVSRQA
jgi:hypothetical protein